MSNAEDADEAKLYRIAGWASRQEHVKKRVARELGTKPDSDERPASDYLD